MGLRLRNILPRGLYGRAALILIVPIVTIQAVVSIVFVQRHFENVARAMADGVAAEVRLIADVLAAEDAPGALALAGALGIGLAPAPAPPPADVIGWEDFSGRAAAVVLHDGLADLIAVDFSGEGGGVQLYLRTAGGPQVFTVPRSRMTARNPHQLLVLMVFTGLVMTGVAYAFLRNQLRPIAQLADAAEAFGKGRKLPYRPRGATEVRAAGAAFEAMRNRIERQIEQRTLMLSGISHDLRTPLTRLRLGVAMLPPGPEAEGMEEDLTTMERMLTGFLSFARDAATEAPQPADPAEIAAGVAGAVGRAGQVVTLDLPAPGVRVMLRVDALGRALENLLSNAARYGAQVALSVQITPHRVIFVVEDDGPGIPPDRRDEAMRPFVRLDPARDPNRGGVGLGLAIAADVARSHGGVLRLEASTRLGGLRAVMDLPR